VPFGRSPLTIYPQVHTHSMSDPVENLLNLRLGVQLIITPKIISNNSFWVSKFVELRELPVGLSDEFDSIKTFFFTSIIINRQGKAHLT
jgi:hypothetical protein